MRSSRVGAPLEDTPCGASTRNVSSGIEAMAAEAIRRVIESSCCETYKKNKPGKPDRGPERAALQTWPPHTPLRVARPFQGRDLRNRSVGDLQSAIDDAK